MWLTRILFSQRSTPGRQYIGKHRLVRKITACQRKNKRDQEKKIANVERLLSRPYLTAEQERGHAAERKQQDRTAFLIAQKKSRRLGPDVYAFGSLTDKAKGLVDHLDVSRVQHGLNKDDNS